jgi:hypothetical protein
MAKTYSPNLLATSVKDQLRLAIGDSNTEDADLMILDDAEISFIISRQNLTATADAQLKAAAVGCLDVILKKFADGVAYSASKVSEQSNQRYTQFLAERNRLANGGKLFTDGLVVPSNFLIGGINLSEINSNMDDTSIRQPVFDKGRDDHPGSSVDRGEGNIDDPLS